ncbi:MAG: hypothetical protein FWG53_09845 [Clostridiales bacterium]|nr:hypothetical protein [Clostridiales bacterium]
MGFASEIKKSTVVYSLASGFNLYYFDGAECEVLGKTVKLLKHAKPALRKGINGAAGGEVFYMREVPGELAGVFDVGHWTNLIRRPAGLAHYAWPVDVVDMAGERGKPAQALVFPYRPQGEYENLKAFLSNLDMDSTPQNFWPDSGSYLGLENGKIRKLADSLLEAWCSYDASKYAYHEFSCDNMYYEPTGCRVKFDFSFSTHRAGGLADSAYVERTRVASDYADTHYFNGGTGRMDLASDYYSIAAILFKLLIGKLPYAGGILEGEPNGSEKEHSAWMKAYHDNPVFIFDQDDRSNKLGAGEPDIYENRWMKLTSQLRGMFQSAFKPANALREAQNPQCYSPSDWKSALKIIDNHGGLS